VSDSEVSNFDGFPFCKLSQASPQTLLVAFGDPARWGLE
jgi:hypothetical protein